MATPPLGWIEPKDRTKEQNDGHAKAMSKMARFALPPVTTAGPVKVMLCDFWKDPDVVKDCGKEFTGFRQLTGSCFPAGTPVRMADGYERSIEDVKEGDCVVSHTGQTRFVVETMRRDYTGEVFALHVSGFPFPLEMTADHQVAVSVGDEIHWKRADEIEKGDRVLIGWGNDAVKPELIDTVALLGEDCIVLDELMKDHAYTKGNDPDVPNSNINSARRVMSDSGIDWRGKVRLHRTLARNAINRHIPVCPSFGRLIGLYLAEGGCDEGRVVFTFHAKERDTLAAEVLSLVRGLFGAEGELESRDARPNTVKVRFDNQNLAAVLKALVPGNVYTKRVPGFFFTTDEQTRLALLLGWMAGDGYVGVKGGKKPGNVRITGVTVCAELARDMTTLALSCGLKATTSKRKARKQSRAAYDVNFAGKKAVSLFPVVASRANGPRYGTPDRADTPHGYARPVKQIERRPVERLPVFDFEVEADHSFIAGGLVVHNCVGVSAGNAVFTVSAVQRKLADNPTKAFIPWWPYPYGSTRYNEGDRGQGEGAVDSIMGQTLLHGGLFGIEEVPDEPQFDTSDGFAITARQELTYSDGAYSGNTKYAALAKQHPIGAAGPLYSTQDIKTAILNGYPVLYGCEYYVGHGTLNGDVALGNYDGRGGHSTCFLGYWDHPTLGPLYLESNQWDGNTYPQDGSGKGRCMVWMKEANVARLFQMGGNDGETMALSHLSYFPAQIDKILDYTSI